MIVVAAGCGSAARHAAPTATVSFPNTPVGRQARWLVGAVTHPPIPAAEIRAHFDRAYLAHVPSPAAAALNASFAGLQRLRVDSVTTPAPDRVALIVTVNGTTRQRVSIAVDAHGLISALRAQPAGVAPPAQPPPGVRELRVGVGSPPLKAMLTLPAGSGPFPAVVLVSGSGPSDQDETVGPNKPFLDIALGLAARGIATVRYDKRTRDYPRSLNRRTFTLTQEYVPDALAAVHLLEHEPAVDSHRIFVLGHSQGGTYAPLIAKRAPQLAGVILLAAGSEPLGAAMLRQVRYLATLPDPTGSQAKAQLREVTRIAAEIDNPAALEKDSPATVLFGVAGPAYFLSGLRYDEVATARSIPQPLLLLQGDRDYQVTVASDLDVWRRGLAGRKGVTITRFPQADHLFLDGAGPPTPLEYQKPGHVDPKLIPTIASWIDKVKSSSGR
jgi:pimeloyl-ACP methyl ester carboxylesterase